MALAERTPRKPPKARAKLGSATPRLAPPTPARSLGSEFVATAATLGVELLPWQAVAGRYIYATGRDGAWLYPEIVAVVARQNGKTELLVPHIVRRLEMGRRIMHTAQNRELPRHVFGRVASIMESRHPDVKVRRGAGQETVEWRDGLYRIVAPNRAGARGGSNDDLIVDEVREFDDMEFMAAAEPTLTASTNPQTLYLSNAGEDDSLVLNTLRLRSEGDPSLAYLEWSASPERPSDDRAGWYEANPSLGHFPRMLDYLERIYVSHQLAGTLAIFETEHLCRWVKTTREKLVAEYDWLRCAAAELEKPRNAHLAVSMDPKGRRASVALAWRQSDDTIALRLLFNVTGNPIDPDLFGREVAQRAARLGVRGVGFDPITDAALARTIAKPKPESIGGSKYANATAQFVNIVTAGRLRWHDADAVTDDLTWTARKHDREAGSFEAVRASDDHPITASLAAIRAVWLASGNVAPKPKVL